METESSTAPVAESSDGKARYPDDDRGPGTISGNLTSDPDLRYTDQGRPVSNMRVAGNERVFNEKTRKWEKGPTAFWSLQAWGELAEHAVNSLQYGDRLVATGRWRFRSYERRDGSVSSEVILVCNDIGASLVFNDARVIRPERSR